MFLEINYFYVERSKLIIIIVVKNNLQVLNYDVRKMKGINMNNQINNIMSVINSGRIFTACFTKKDGSERVMNCRTQVSKNVTGKGMSYDPKNLGYLVVFDMKRNDFRMINLNTLKWVKADGLVFDLDTDREVYHA